MFVDTTESNLIEKIMGLVPVVPTNKKSNDFIVSRPYHRRLSDVSDVVVVILERREVVPLGEEVQQVENSLTADLRNPIEDQEILVFGISSVVQFWSDFLDGTI